MTAFADDPMLTHLCTQTDLLLSTVRTLDDAAVRGPSRLPGWTRGHVLTHLARNADGLANVAGSAVTGRVTPMYLSVEARDGDIEAGADRPAAVLEADVESSAERLLAQLAAVPVERVDLTVPSGRGPEVSVAKLPWTRTREVVYHHIDLDAGFTFADVPDVLLRAGLLECPPRLADAAPGARLTCTFADGELLELTIGDGAVPVRGQAADVLAWLTGRGDGSSLEAGGQPLPALPSWG
ncbi:MAG: maleylpyruvate isomerase family mycothiol-dependent enzyme [Angustibacter sp.]